MLGIASHRDYQDERYATAVDKELQRDLGELESDLGSQGSNRESNAGDQTLETLDIMGSLRQQLLNTKERQRDQRNAKKSSRTKRRDESIKSNRRITDFMSSKRKNGAESIQGSSSNIGGSVRNSRASFGSVRSKSKSPTRSDRLESTVLNQKQADLAHQTESQISQTSNQEKYDEGSARQSKDPDAGISITPSYPCVNAPSDQDESRQDVNDSFCDLIQELQKGLIEVDSDLELSIDDK